MHRFESASWMSRIIFLSFIGLFYICGFCDANVSSRIFCDEDEMRVELTGSHIKEAYLLGLKNYPEPSCQPDRVSSDLLKFRLSLRDFYRCGTAQILNKITGARTFYNRIVIEADGKDSEILVKCQQEVAYLNHVNSNHLNATLREKRDVLPAGFVEPLDLNITDTFIQRTSEPMLRMLVRQDGRVIGQELLVSPGSPLTMEVSLDERSTDLYGILMSRLDVTDTGEQSEVILYNGCSVDSYLFNNFVTSDGDLLTANFRAFKFPDTNYVLFRGTVNVCLGICKPTDCSNGQIGYGRRRRRSIGMEKERLYEIKMTTILRIDNQDPSGLQDPAILISSGRFGNNEAKLQRDTIQAEFITAASHSSLRQLSIPITTFSLLMSLLATCSFLLL